MSNYHIPGLAACAGPLGGPGPDLTRAPEVYNSERVTLVPECQRSPAEMMIINLPNPDDFYLPGHLGPLAIFGPMLMALSEAGISPNLYVGYVEGSTNLEDFNSALERLLSEGLINQIPNIKPYPRAVPANYAYDFFARDLGVGAGHTSDGKFVIIRGGRIVSQMLFGRDMTAYEVDPDQPIAADLNALAAVYDDFLIRDMPLIADYHAYDAFNAGNCRLIPGPDPERDRPILVLGRNLAMMLGEQGMQTLKNELKRYFGIEETLVIAPEPGLEQLAVHTDYMAQFCVGTDGTGRKRTVVYLPEPVGDFYPQKLIEEYQRAEEQFVRLGYVVEKLPHPAPVGPYLTDTVWQVAPYYQIFQHFQLAPPGDLYQYRTSAVVTSPASGVAFSQAGKSHVLAPLCYSYFRTPDQPPGWVSHEDSLLAPFMAFWMGEISQEFFLETIINKLRELRNRANAEEGNLFAAHKQAYKKWNITPIPVPRFLLTSIPLLSGLHCESLTRIPMQLGIPVGI